MPSYFKISDELYEKILVALKEKYPEEVRELLATKRKQKLVLQEYEMMGILTKFGIDIKDVKDIVSFFMEKYNKTPALKKFIKDQNLTNRLPKNNNSTESSVKHPQKLMNFLLDKYFFTE